MKRLFALLMVAVLAVAVFAGCATTTETNGKTIAVIAKGESHAFWQSVKAGAEAAGAKYGYNITFRGPASESAKDLLRWKWFRPHFPTTHLLSYSVPSVKAL